MLVLHVKCTIIVSLISCCCYSQFNFSTSNGNNLISGIRSQGTDNVFSVFDNVAHINESASFQIGICANSNFLIPDIKSYFAAVAFSPDSGNFKAGIAYNGFQSYNESMIKLAYSRSLSKRTNAGLSFNILQLYVQNNKTIYLYNFDIGFSFKADDHIFISANLSNPLPYGSSNQFNSLNYGSMAITFNYKLSEKLVLTSSSFVKIEKPVLFSFGLEYEMIRTMDLLISVSTDPALFNLGFIFNNKKLKIGTASAYHQQLGISPQFSIQYINEGNAE